MMPLLQKALNKSYELHKHAKRKNSDVSYLVHIFDAAKYLMYETNDQEIIAAGLLHDTLEDTNYSEEELKHDFNERIYSLVKFSTEPKNNIHKTKQEMKESWKERKQHSISKLKNGTYEELLVFLADKTSNLRSIQEDILFKVGVWSKFNASKQEIEWYYTSIRDALKEKLGKTRLFHVFESLFDVFN